MIGLTYLEKLVEQATMLASKWLKVESGQILENSNPSKDVP